MKELKHLLTCVESLESIEIEKQTMNYKNKGFKECLEFIADKHFHTFVAPIIISFNFVH